MPERESLYRILQVDPGANQLVIQAAYRVLARIFHPDVEGDDAAMKRLNHAWSVLGDPLRRAEYDRQSAGQHIGPVTSSVPATPRPAPSAATTTASSAVQRPRPHSTTKDDHAGRPQGEPSGSVLSFGRYEGWTVGQVARVDPPFLEWLRRVPLGRALKPEIDLALQRAEGARRFGIGRAPADSDATNDRPVHTWAPGAPTRVR